MRGATQVPPPVLVHGAIRDLPLRTPLADLPSGESSRAYSAGGGERQGIVADARAVTAT
jgi:hypothetical protein